jgi:tRNA pseudouridine38-40 synthase
MAARGPTPRTLRLTLQYDGTGLVGWQRQKQGVSVQGLLEAALGRLAGRPVAVAGAGRTDAGVHALGQVASCRLATALGEAELLRALNALLPPAVRVVEVARAPDDFHARFSARAKTYEYRLFLGPVLPPFERYWVWHVPEALDLAAMRRAARPLVGRHDFAAFRGAGGAARDSVRTIHSLHIVGAPPRVAVRVRADGFLRHMVRAIVGTLVDVGRGRRTAASVAEALASRDRARAGPTAPPQGLFLVAVEY